MFAKILKKIEIILKSPKTLVILGFMCLYLLLGIFFSYKHFTYNDNDFFFGADNARAFKDLTAFHADHYRAKVHPLFILLFQPIIYILNFAFANIVSVIILQSIIGAASIAILFKILELFKIDEKIAIILTLIYGFGFTNMIFTAIPETFIFASFLLLLMWWYILKLIDKNASLTIQDYLLLILLGIGALAITITNIVQYCIALVLLIYIKDKNNSIIKSIFNLLYKTFIIITLVILLSIGLAIVQKVIWHSAENFFVNLIDMKDNSSNEEFRYMDFSISTSKVKEGIVVFFGNSITASKVEYDQNSKTLYFHETNVINKIMIIMLSTLIVGTMIGMLKNKSTIDDKLFLAALVLALSFNFVLHIIYGSYEQFLYSQHFMFLVILIIGLGFKFYKKNNLKYLIPILIVYLLFELVFNFTAVLKVYHYVGIYFPNV